MFKTIKLWFTDRNYYHQRKRFMKKQKAVRKELKKQAKEFCPWSGYYMHKMICTMLNFYHQVYEDKDCCWSESACEGKVARSLKEAVDAATNLDWIDDLDEDQLISVARKDGVAFYNFLKQYEEKVGFNVETKSLLSGVAYSYLEKKYTRKLYNTIGEHIWEWMD